MRQRKGQFMGKTLLDVCFTYLLIKMGNKQWDDNGR